jgi:hypothetical protein
LRQKCLLFAFTCGHVYAFFIDSLLTKWAQTALASLKAAKALDEKPDKGNGFLIETSVENLRHQNSQQMNGRYPGPV